MFPWRNKAKSIDEQKLEKFCTIPGYIEKFLILAYTTTGCISISDFSSLTGVPIGNTSSAIALKIWAIAAGIKRCDSIIKKNKKTMIKYYF